MKPDSVRLHGVRHFRKHVGSYWKRLENQEITVLTALRGVAVETWELFKRVLIARPSKGRKAGIHLVKKGIAAFNEKDYKTAVGFFEKAIKHDPDYARAYTYLGNTQYKQGKYGDAVSSWNKAIKTEPNSDAADMAREKLDRVKNQTSGLIATIENQMKSE